MSNGDQNAAAQLMPLVYSELRKLAAHYMNNETPGHTLQATALVHEAYFRLVEQTRVNYQGRAHFFAISAQLMRRILVDHARAKHAAKRGSNKKLPLDAVASFAADADMDLVGLDDALNRLADLDPQQSRIVEMRYFAGLSIEDTATALGISPSSVKRGWNMAKAWLHRELVTAGK